MPALLDVAREQLALTAQKSLTRSLKETERVGAARVRRGGKEYVSFSCNDYLGLAHDPRVIAAAREALERFGAGAGASRLVTGSHPAYTELERLLAELKGTERALVFGSGYLANLGVIPALVGKNDLILADRLSHACTWDGARLSGATVLRFDHNDLADCRELLGLHRGRFARCLISTETVFSMDGDRAPVAELSALAERARRLAIDRRCTRSGNLYSGAGRRSDGHPVEGGRQLRGIRLRQGGRHRLFRELRTQLCYSRPGCHPPRSRRRRPRCGL